MYDKIYKEIFLKDFILKRKIYSFEDEEQKNLSIWEVLIYNKSYYLVVHLENINDFITPEERNHKEYTPRNEAELVQFRYGKCTTEKRITANRLFLEVVRRYVKDAPYLFRAEKLKKNKKVVK